MTRRPLTVAVLACCLGGTVVIGQETLPVVRDRVEVSLVNVTVVATDADGKPVYNLTASDFTVLDDGKAVEVRNVAAAPVATAGSTDSNTPSDAPATASLQPVSSDEPYTSIVLFADNANCKPAQRNAVLDKLRPILHESMTSRATRVMVASGALGVQVEQIFTSDTTLLDAALERVAKQGAQGGFSTTNDPMLSRLIDSGVGGSADFAGADAYDQLLSVQNAAQSAYDSGKSYFKRLTVFISALGGIPGRKIVLWVGDGMLLRPGERLLQQWQATYGGSGDSSATSAMADATRYNLSMELTDLLHQANASRVHIIAIAPAGSSGTSGSADQAVMEKNLTIGNASLEKMGQEQTLAAMAVSTGGEAVIGGDVAARALSAVATLGSAYSLGFVNTHGGDGKYHTLKISVKRPGVAVRHSEGYLEKTPDARAADAALSGLYLDAPDNPLELGLAVRSMKKEKGDSYSVVLLTMIPLGNVILSPKDDAHEGKLALWLAARDATGRVTQSTRQNLPVRVPNETLAAAQGQSAGFTFSLSLPSGPTRAAVTVVDQLGQVQSTTALDLEVRESEPAEKKP